MSLISRELNPDRVLSLDIFRGMSIAGMIIVNCQASEEWAYRPFVHPLWNGLTAADFVFPSFVFIMGVAIAFATKRRGAGGPSAGTVYSRILRRVAILFILGIVFSSDPSKPESFRAMGVLQRLALVYFFATVISMYTNEKGQAAAAVLLIAAYWALMKLVPVPGFGAGDLSRQGNLAAYIDNMFLKGHLYTPDWDPEGILHTLPAIASGLFGVLAGQWLKRKTGIHEKMAGLSVAGTIFVVIGLGVNHWFPINKNLWSPSFVFVTTGFAMNFLSVCMWFVDYKGIKTFCKPFIVLGVNSITAVLFSDILMGIPTIIFVNPAGGEKAIAVKEYILMSVFSPVTGPRMGSLVYALCCLVIALGLMGFLYKKRIFVKI